ncbi:MAG: hypothetical protein NUW01_08875 [Gemmatimonadaceae bacterium]|nr:hypothetical protein [Gemmatimonadaceae bacterium]
MSDKLNDPKYLRSLIADMVLTLRFSLCDHRGIGKPGCYMCDPRVYDAERMAHEEGDGL